MKYPLPALMFAVSTIATAAPISACPTVDAFDPFVELARRTADLPDAARIAAFDRDFVPRYADLYVPTATGWSPGSRLDAAALEGLHAADKDPGLHARDVALVHALETVVQVFASAFPDFRCDFPIFLAPTFGHMDGAGRLVGGKPSLVLGPDVIARFETDDQLPVFLAHELFHRYHYEAAGYSDDLAERDLIWRTLWAEGLATYVSARLNPARPLADALLLPRDLQTATDPFVRTLSAELIPGLDRVDPALFALYFQYGDPAARRLGRPSRTGYYLGYLVASKLGRHRTLAELAHLQGSELRLEIGEALAELASASATGTAPAGR